MAKVQPNLRGKTIHPRSECLGKCGHLTLNPRQCRSYSQHGNQNPEHSLGSVPIVKRIESCRRRGLDPYTYLKDVLTRLPTMTNHQIPEVTPAAWAKARRQLQRQAAA